MPLEVVADYSDASGVRGHSRTGGFGGRHGIVLVLWCLWNSGLRVSALPRGVLCFAPRPDADVVARPNLRTGCQRARVKERGAEFTLTVERRQCRLEKMDERLIFLELVVSQMGRSRCPTAEKALRSKWIPKSMT